MNAIPAPTIRHILVLCEGNYCRSPMAEHLLRASLGAAQSEEVIVESAGMGALHGRSADPEAEHLMAARGIDLSGHRARMLTTKAALSADLILVMEQGQKTRCEQMVPSARGRVFLLGHWLPSDQQEIADPYRQGTQAFRAALDHIERSVATWLPRLTHPQRPPRP